MLGLVAGLVSSSAAALADDMADARSAYERGALAYKKKQYTEAAREFARADELVPNAVTLQEALKAAMKGDDAALGMTLVERAENRGGSAALTAAATEARDQFGKLAGRLAVACPDPRPCTVKIDGTPATSGQGRWVSAGDHRVEIGVGGETSAYSVAVAAGGRVDWKPSPSERKLEGLSGGGKSAGQAGAQPLVPKREGTGGEPDAAGPEPSSRTVLSPTWFYATLGATVAIGGVATWSLVDSLGKHNAYVDGEAASPDKGADLRTNILLGAAGVAVVGTVVVGVLSFSRAKESSASTTITLGAGSVSLTTRY